MKCASGVDTDVFFETFKDIIEKHNITGKVPKKADMKFEDFQKISKGNLLKGLFSAKPLDRREAATTLKKLVKSSLVIKTKTNKAVDHASEFYTEMPGEIREALAEFSVNIDGSDIKIGTGQALAALHIIKSGIDTEEVLYKKYGVPVDYREKMRGTTDLTRLYAVIGRAMVTSNGEKFTLSSEVAHARYAQLGKKIVGELANKGLVDVKEGMVVDTGTVNVKGNIGKKGRAADTIPVIADIETVAINEELAEIIEQYPSEFSQLQKLILPIKIKLPLTAEDNLKFNWNMSPDANVEPKSELKEKLGEVYTNLQSRGYKLDQELVGYLRDVKTRIETGNVTFVEALREDTPNFSILKAVFGYDMTKSLDLDIYKESLDGKELSRVSPLQDLIENIDHYNDKEIFTRLFLARNGRTHSYDSVLNVQADKFMSRWIMQPATEAVFEGKDAKDLLVTDVAIHLGIGKDKVTGKVRDKAFEALYRAYTRKDHANFADKLQDVKVTMSDAGFKDKDFWKVYTAMGAVQDVREAGDGPIKTRFTTEVDATASGALIKLLYAMGAENANDIIEKFLGGDYEDAYVIGQNKIKELIGSDKVVPGFKGKQLDTLLRVLADKKGITYDIKDEDSFNDLTRELLKYAIMTYLYGQSAKNNKRQVGDAFAEDIIQLGTDLQGLAKSLSGLETNFKDFEYVNKAVKEFEEVVGNDKEVTNENAERVREAFVSLVEKTVGTVLAEDVLKEEYTRKLFEKFDTSVDALYKELSEALDLREDMTIDNVEIRGPLQLIEDGLEGTSKIKLSKLKETFVDVVGVGKTVSLREHLNPISAKVIPVHAVDSAVLLRTVAKFINHTKTEEGLEFLKSRGITEDVAKHSALSLIHDAIIAEPRVARLLAEFYEDSLIEVTYKYDVREALLEAVETLTGKESESRSGVMKDVAAKKKAMEEKFEIVNGVVNRPIDHSFRTNHRKELESIRKKEGQDIDQEQETTTKEEVETKDMSTDELINYEDGVEALKNLGIYPDDEVKNVKDTSEDRQQGAEEQAVPEGTIWHNKNMNINAALSAVEAINREGACK